MTCSTEFFKRHFTIRSHLKIIDMMALIKLKKSLHYFFKKPPLMFHMSLCICCNTSVLYILRKPFVVTIPLFIQTNIQQFKIHKPLLHCGDILHTGKKKSPMSKTWTWHFMVNLLSLASNKQKYVFTVSCCFCSRKKEIGQSQCMLVLY